MCERAGVTWTVIDVSVDDSGGRAVRQGVAVQSRSNYKTTKTTPRPVLLPSLPLLLLLLRLVVLVLVSFLLLFLSSFLLLFPSTRIKQYMAARRLNSLSNVDTGALFKSFAFSFLLYALNTFVFVFLPHHPL